MQTPQYQQPAPTETTQTTKFYKVGFFDFFVSAVGKFQRDCERMTAQGWNLQFAQNVGKDALIRSVIVATYVRQR